MVLASAGLLPVNLCGQQVFWKDTVVLASFPVSPDSVSSLVRCRISGKMDYSLSSTSLFYLNKRQSDANLVSLLHRFHYRVS
ncbi:MAG: hypothetical protein ACOYNC_02405 [Bacteroidales bacterium]